MKIYYNYLSDTDFLKELSKMPVKTYFVHITILSWDEQPITAIQGRVISANFNIDGQSSVRRTANLSIALDQSMTQIIDAENVLSINKKINVQIGYYNDTQYYKEYDILWFPLGTYIVISCATSESDSGLVASLQLQDKMCLLNGFAGGTIPAAADLHLIDTLDEDGNPITIYPTIYQIIQELVHHWGGEQLGKIIISDLDNEVKRVMKWNLNKPLYYIEAENNDFYFANENEWKTAINEFGTKVSNTSIFSKGKDVGYIYTDFTFPGELIADAGSSVTDNLDKIIQVLGNYEYFYDLDGNFVFQEKKNYFNNAQSLYILQAKNNVEKDSNGNIIKDADGNPIPDPKLVPDYVASFSNRLSSYLMDMTSGTSAFTFEDSRLIKSYSNTPQYGAIKNDFVIWGIRTTSDGYEIPLRYHLAIDTIPKIKKDKYLMFNYKEYQIDKYGVWKMPIIVVEEGKVEEEKRKIKNKKITEYKNTQINITEEEQRKAKEENRDFLPPESNKGQYYLRWDEDSSSYMIKYSKKENGVWKWVNYNANIEEIQATDWRTQLLLEGAAAQIRGLEYNYYYPELKVEWPKIYDLVNQKYYDQVLEHPADINYFLDFINTGNPKITQISVKNIGRRSYIADKGKNVNCVFEEWIPDVIIVKKGDAEGARKANVKGQHFSQVSEDVYNNLDIGGSNYSAYEQIRQTLHEFTNYNESVSLQTIPLYFLEPNTRISINNPNSAMTGDYIINSMSFSLDNEGLLTINASKAVEKV